MGVYLYTFRKKPKGIVVNGETKQAYPLTFTTKLHSENTRKDERTAVAAHERFEGVKPDFYVLDVFTEDAPVYSNPTCGYWYDTDKVPGTYIGNLKKSGRQWVVVPPAKKQEVLNSGS